MCKRFLIVLSLGILASFQVYSQKKSVFPDDPAEKKWVDSVYNSLSEAERIGQLFMVAAYSNRDEKHLQQLEKLVVDQKIGGLIFFQGGPLRQAHMTNHLQQLAKIPLWIGMDAEWGLGMRLDSTISFPKQMTLGAIQNDSLIYEMGAEIARQCKLLGVHINFAPVVDVNVNRENPVIGYRAFSENKELVVRKAKAYARGLQDHGVIANIKHFPGHGDTSKDSHYSLPVIDHSKERLRDVELYPFQQLFDDSVRSVMIAHLQVTAYEKNKNTASTLSKPIVTDLLKDEMGYDGLVFTDALNMKGVSNYYKGGELEVMAFKAGNDVLLFPLDVPLSIQKIQQSLKNGQISEKQLEISVKKILRNKYWLGLTTPQQVDTLHLHRKLNSPQAKLLRKKLYEESITVVRNKKNLLPITNVDQKSFASLSVGLGNDNEFQDMLSNYAPFNHFDIPSNRPSLEEYNRLYGKLKNYQTIVVGIQGNNSPSRNFGMKTEDYFLVQALQMHSNVIVVLFGNAYGLQFFEDFQTVLTTYEDDPMVRFLVPQILFGAKSAKGGLPITVGNFNYGTGVKTAMVNRLRYGMPEEVRMNSEMLQKIDEVVMESIADKAMPGAQVIVARKGQVVYHKAFGAQDYENHSPIDRHTIYDVASITKVAATMQAVMFLEERGELDLDKRLVNYLPELRKTNKKNLEIKDVLTHQAGLKPFLPHWQRTVDEFGPNPLYYRIYPEPDFQVNVAHGLYAYNHLQDSIWHWTLESELLEKPRRAKNFEYKYSDIGFYLMHKTAERLLNQPMHEFLEYNFYQPLGMGNTSFLPLCRFPEERIAPTELDQAFRKTLVRGTVHDPGAAMYGGVAGHAGLFSTANDLAILMQMLLNGGTYGGVRFLEENTIKKFTAQTFPANRRGLGWDRPTLNGLNGPTSHYASPKTFGHTGFTGTAAWVDPEFELVYIFLSNRVYPDAGNNKLIKNSIRTRIMDLIYESMWEFEKTNL